MREGLRSSSSRKEDGKVGEFRRVEIPDLNLEEELDDVLSEEVGKLCEVSKPGGEFDGLVGEKEGLGVDEGKGVGGDNEGEKDGSSKLECGFDVAGERYEIEEGVEGQVGDADGSVQVCPTVEIVVEKELDECARNMEQDTDVGGVQNEAGTEGLNCPVDSDAKVLKSRSVVVEGVGKDGNVEDDKREMLSPSVEGEVKKDLKRSSRSIIVYSDRKIKGREEQSSSGAVSESPQKMSVTMGSVCNFDDEGEVSKRPKAEAKQGKVQVVARVLRSRVVPANGLGEESESRNTRVSHCKRKKGTSGLGEEAAVMKDEGSKSAVDSEDMCDSGKSKRSNDHSEEELVEPSNAIVVFEAKDEDVNNKLIKSSEKKRKRGRPKKCRDYLEEQVVQINEVKAVSKAEYEDLSSKSARSSKKKDGRGRPRKSANGFEKGKVVPDKVKKEVGDVSKKSVGSLTPRRQSGRPKRSVDYCEEKVGQKRRKLSFSLVDDEVLTEDDRGLSNIPVSKSKKKGKRGRPKKELGKGLLKVGCHDKDKDKDDDKGKDDRKTKVSFVSAPVRKNRQDIHSPGVSESPSDGVSTRKEIASAKKVTFSGLENNVVKSSFKGEETPLPESNLSVKRKRVEAAGSLSGEKNLIRQQIVDMLVSAGWTIEYRPRNGRHYNDAVYVNREGKTHWSVTKAYSTLQREFEEAKAGSESGEPDFTFTPLPNEVLSKLFRVVSKTRSDKNKKKKHKGDGDTSDEEVSEKNAAGHKAKSKHKLSAMKRKPSVRNGTQGRRRCALLVRRSNQGSNLENDGAIAHPGKHSVLSWMIGSGTISLDGKVQFMNCPNSESLLEGSITRDGIRCCCCKEIISISEFANHAGSKLCQPYENLYMESGSSLLQCQLDSWNKQEETSRVGFYGVNVDVDDPNDDTCAICGDGGDLMCCDGCPSTFHVDCLNVEEVPSGEWHCVYCSCKYCGVGGESATGTQEVDCDAVSSQLATCKLCEDKYHRACVSEEDDGDVKYRKLGFCGRNCEQMSKRLESLLGTKCDLGDGFSWTLLQRSDLKEDSVTVEPQKVQNNCKLAVALSVMEECFLPILDPRSGVNLIRHVVYSCGSNFNRLNFSSFLTIVLEKGDEIISAASIRIRGKQLAEMPFIGTRNIYRRQGMCRRLLAAIELALSSLEIEELVIPAIPELLHTWTSIFGFKPLEESVREEMRSMNMLVFAHTDMLQKPIQKPPSLLKDTTSIEKDTNSGVSQNGHLDGTADKIDADEPEVDDGSLNGKFDLNCVAPSHPDSSSDEKQLAHLDSDAENCEEEVKSSMNSSEVKTLQPDLNLMAENESLSDEKSLVRRDSDTINSDEVAKSTSNSSGLTNVKGCCTVENDGDQNGDSTAVRCSEERTLNPDLNEAGNVLETNDGLPGLTNVKGCCTVENGGDQNGDPSADRSSAERTMNPDLNVEGTVLETNDILPDLTNVNGCCTVGNDGDQNWDSTAVRSTRERTLNPDINGNVLENNDSLPSNAESVFAPTSLERRDDNLVEVTNCSQNLGGEAGPSNFQAVCQTPEIQCSDVETSTTLNVGTNNSSLPAGVQLPTKSSECTESGSLVVCTRVPQVTSESMCNISSAAGESCVAVMFHGSGIAKVGPTKS